MPDQAQGNGANPLARSEVYTLLAEVYRYGPVGGCAERIRSISELKELVSDESEEERAATHQTMFGFNVFPYASVFLEQDGHLGKAVCASAREYFERSGFTDRDSREMPDHISEELLFCSWQSANPLLLKEFIDSHLIAWLPTFTSAVRRRENQFYSTLVQFTIDFIVDQRSNLPDHAMARSENLFGVLDGSGAQPEEMPTDLEAALPVRLAQHFLCARRAGLFLSRADITMLARRRKLPTGFGSRTQMLRTLFDSSVSYGAMKEVIDDLQELCNQERDMWMVLEESVPFEAVLFWSSIWRNRLRFSSELLLRVQFGDETVI